jgi:MFS family permease
VPNVPLLLAILGGFVACVVGLTVVSGFWPVVAVSVLLGYVIHSLFPAIDTYMLASLPDRHRASAYAGYSATMMVIQAFGSVSVGTLVGAGYGYDLVFRALAAGLVAVLAALVALHLAGRLPAGRAHDPERGHT